MDRRSDAFDFYQVLVSKARKSAQAYWKIYGEYPPTRVLVQELATVMQQATQSGYVFAHIFSLILTFGSPLSTVA